MDNKAMKLWYTKPAEIWEKHALPIGNGRLGAMFFGGYRKEHIQINEETLYSGKPSKSNEKAYLELAKIREYLEKGDYALAQEHTNEVFLKSASYGDSSDFGMYQNLGDIFIDFNNTDEQITDYIRELDISNAIGKVSYKSCAKLYEREYFSSYPDNVMVFKFSCSEKESINMKLTIKGGQPNSKTTTIDDGTIFVNGTTTNLYFETRIKVVANGGTIDAKEDCVCVNSADSVVVLLSASTNYNGEYPDYIGKDYKAYNDNVISKALDKTYEQLKSEHISDYKELFDRVVLKLGDEEKENIPTDERLANYKKGETDKHLEMLLFQYGRYLLIGSSRQGTLPANLQGIWNESNDPKWGSIFCYNINLNMNYWHANTTNLAECHTPLIDFIDSLRPSGRESAKAYFNANGWFTAKKSDIWGFTQPYAIAINGLFIGGCGWLCQDVWERYAFTKDLEYLKNVAYPIIKECSEFYLDYLTINKDGYLVSSPSTSPENSFKIDGKSFYVSDGAEMDHRIIEEVFTNCIEICNLLAADNDFKERLIEAKSKIAPTKIGRFGQIQEWYHDWDDPKDTNRHISQIYAVHPGNTISPIKTSELADAAVVTMNTRGDLGTGWSISWKINIWARLLNANKAYLAVKNLLRNCIYDNLFATHPPFQIDANFGFSAGVAEMLVQSSYNNEIHLLPALPCEWETGSVCGLRTRGGFEIELSWSKGELVFARINGVAGRKGRIRYKDTLYSFTINQDGFCDFSTDCRMQ